ncbi:MAG TPA: tetratricopeptide repeat protein [Verrucomicrobiae bacterium]|jgi:tetratricopeptide (TPR) repeat protein|nr:tetratricopeptide repeat protein [Verrucomicrobiae bacterium]
MLLLLTVAFSVAAWVEPQYQERQEVHSGDMMSFLLGDSRRLFANHFFVKADVYFHSGFYPTIFDNQQSFQTPHMAEDAGALKGHNEGDETAFMGPPLDFIEAFRRHFAPSSHTHLDEGGAQGTNGVNLDLGEKGGEVREILPWLKISAELDPNRIETYMVTAYWLRKRMGKVDEAEEFLREGLRANPNNPAILYELGRIYHEDRTNDVHAINLWELGVRKMDEQKSVKTEQDNFILFQLTLSLARVEEDRGNYARAIQWLEREKAVSPYPDVITKQIEDDRQKLADSQKSGADTPAKTGSQPP